MPKVDTSQWTPVGATSKCECYAVTPYFVVMIPHEGMRDTAESAFEQVFWQDAYWEKLGHPGCVGVFMDNIVDQDTGAREVYAGLRHPPDGKVHGQMTLGYVLIGGTFWGRAVAAVYTGLRKPPRPTRFFATLEDAMPWVEELTREVRQAGA
jgi:hypothetical protein